MDVVEYFIQNQDYKYVTALGMMYLRLVGGSRGGAKLDNRAEPKQEENTSKNQLNKNP